MMIEAIVDAKYYLDNRYYEKVGSEVKDITEAIDLGCPRNWTFVRLRDLIELISGRDLLPAQYNSDKIGIPYITGASNLLNERIIINRWTDTPSVVSHKGDLLITCKGTIGEMVFNNIGDVHIARQIMSIRCIGVNSLFIMLVLKSYVSQLQSGAKSFIPGISRDDILKLPFIMPPLAEQARIVNRVEELFKQIDAIEQNQADIDTLYDEFRKRTLTLAIQGKLVPQDPNDEPASVLLERIRAEKKAKLGKKYVDSYIYKGDDNCYYEHIADKTQDVLVEVPFELPNGWVWSRLDNLAIYKKGPFGSSLTKDMFVPKSAHSVKVYEQKNAIYKDCSLGSYYISEEKYNEMKNFEVFTDDIIVSCAGTIGETYVLPINCPRGIINQALMKITLFVNEMSEFYLLYFDYVFKMQAQQYSKGSAIKNIPPFEILKRMLMPLPPLAEQKRTVAKINEIFAML